jgi:hypothetical protein
MTLSEEQVAFWGWTHDGASLAQAIAFWGWGAEGTYTDVRIWWKAA